VSFPQRLKAAREAAGLTQAYVAERIGVTRQAVGQWESGESSPNPQTLALLADLYGVSVDDLLGRSHIHIVRRERPLPPPGWELLTEREKREVEEQARAFEEFVVRRILRERRRNVKRKG